MSRDIPIIFSGPMVRALLEGRKTMTRRLANIQRKKRVGSAGYNPGTEIVPSPWITVLPGDRLWVRENVQLISVGPDNARGITYAADENPNVAFFTPAEPGKLKLIGITPCIHMPRWASRLTLAVTATKIEKLAAISESDSIAEGATPEKPFGEIFKALHGADIFDRNPEVVALTFTVHQQNVDALKVAA